MHKKHHAGITFNSLKQMLIRWIQI